ncbi:MAG TPA: hypothetical protein VLT62_13120 [Candidatus Methylomirabilis sp.]|nr:hypothetical protein [Candidatus Methylomirabilis sp.]
MRGMKLGLTILIMATAVITSQEASAIMIPEAAGGVKRVDLEILRGRVTSVNPRTDTVVVAANRKKVTAVVNGYTTIHEWIFPERLADVKVGDRVSMLYEGANHNWVADSIKILPSIPSMPAEGPDIR